MATVKDIADYLETLAPVSLKMDFDNVGLLAGITENTVERALVALDISADVIDEAIAENAEIIVSHHPLFLGPLNRIVDTDSVGRKIIRLLSHGISAVCMHTNLDAAEGGVNDTLAAVLGIEDVRILNTQEGISRMGTLPASMAFDDFLAHVGAVLSVNGLRYHDAGRSVSRVGLCGGSGGDDIALAWENGCDTFVTADVKHHQFLLAKELGINLIDADHFCTENVIVPVLREKLAKRFPEVRVSVSRRQTQPARFLLCKKQI